MSIIDTFVMLFKADTSAVKKGVDESEKDLKRLGNDAKNADAEISKIGKNFLSTAQSFAGLVAGFASVHAAISGFSSALNYTTELSDIARELNINISAVDAWGRALQRTGGSAQSFKSTIESLKSQFGGTSEQMLSQLPKFADALSKLNKDQALIRGKQFGLDVPTILLLQQGRREVESLIQKQYELGVVTKKDAVIARDFRTSLDNVSQAYNTYYRELSRSITPKLTTTFNYLLKHQDAIKGALAAISGVVGGMALAFAAANVEIALFAAAIVAAGLAYEHLKIHGAEIKHTLQTKAESLPSWAQKIIGTKLPDYATPNTHALYRSGVGGSSTSNKNTIHIDNITIQTQATDANGIGVSLIPELNKQLNQVADHFGSSVLI